MDSEATRTPGSMKSKKDLSHEAVNLALQGEWQRAAEVNKALLESFSDDVEAMNRLVKALIELGSYEEARGVLDKACDIAPYNNIAKKHRARLAQLVADDDDGTSGLANQNKKTAGAPQIFIEESGKSGTTVLRNTEGNKAVRRLSASEQVVFLRDKNTVTVCPIDGQFIGHLEPKLGNRLARLMDGGNEYAAAVVTVNVDSVSIIIKETFKHRSLQNVCSFPTKAKEGDRVFLNETVARFIRDEDSDDDYEEENIIDEEEMDTDWVEDE
ncbi:MAG: tetratricopeptide repeat protein [Chloroflexota bacterium]|nr:tetratricopeptide repeat protein [Chloroflexota bacterium]